MVHWHAYALIGVLGGVGAYLLLLRTEAGLVPFLAPGITAAVLEAVLARRVLGVQPQPPKWVILRAALALVLAAGVALGVFVLPYVLQAAPQPRSNVALPLTSDFKQSRPLADARYAAYHRGSLAAELGRQASQQAIRNSVAKSSIEQFYASQKARSATRLAWVALVTSLIGFFPIVSLAISGLSRRSPPGEVQGGLNALDALMSIGLLCLTSALSLAVGLYARRQLSSTTVRVAIAMGRLGLAVVFSVVFVIALIVLKASA